MKWGEIPKAWRRRRAPIAAQRLEAFRLVNGAGDGLAGLYVDCYAGRFLITAERAGWLEERASLEAALQAVQGEIDPSLPPKFFWVANFPGRRGALSGPEAERFTVREDGARYEVELGTGPHSGLFLDQRENRRELRKIARGRRTLNLFCHTGAFTVAALRGGAREVVSVDLSKNYLAWLKRNLALNGLADQPAPCVAAEVRDYLAANRNDGCFDLIVLDPPTFGRSKGQSFSTLRDYGALLEACLRRLSSEGRLLACLNTRKVDAKAFRDFLKSAARAHGRRLLPTPPTPADFPWPAGESPALKSCWLGQG